MIQRLPFLVKLSIAAGTLCALTYALSQERPNSPDFAAALRDYIEGKNEVRFPPAGQDSAAGREERLRRLLVSDSKAPLSYRDGDWNRYVIEPRYSLLYENIGEGKVALEERDDVDVNSYGAAKWNWLHGKSVFTSGKYKLFDTDKPVSRVIPAGTTVENEMQLHMEGRVGDRLTIYIDHDSRRENNQNQYRMQYRAVREDEVIREINAGDIQIKLNNSKYAVYDDTTASGLGIDTTVRKGNLTVKAFGSVTRGETEVESFRGNSSNGNLTLYDYQYIRNTYFQMEAFKRYDGLSAPPANPYTTRTMTSASANFTPYAVSIDSSGFELYMDDQDPLNNMNAISLEVDPDHGKYTKMVLGADYVINFSTGLIQFIRGVPANARIFAVYTIGGGTASSDPAAQSRAQFPGKIFVFIKYGYSIDEDIDEDNVSNGDKNGDGVMNLDIYEVRSFYYLGEKQLLQNNFSLRFYGQDRLLTKTETSEIGSYAVDYTRGVVSFALREPFRQLLSSSSAGVVYSELQVSNVSEASLYRIKADYYREARSFQLKHPNIIPESVRVKVDGRELQSSLYTVDLTSGYFAFVSPNNPVITPETAIEIRYEYLPFAAQAQSFVGGARADYKLSRDLSLGGTMLFTRSASSEVIPVVGSESTQTLVLEGDMTLFLSESRLKELANVIPGVHVDSAPLDIKAYAEYARSYRKTNTFGKGLIDDMESADEVVSISLSEKDWILSSMPTSPSAYAQSERGRLYYYFYRDPSSPDNLHGTGFDAKFISYSKKPGPFNVATGHVADSIQRVGTQRSLVLDYEFTGSESCVPIVTRNLSSGATDFSGLQYVEIWYRAESVTSDVNLFLELGSVSEDSDGDGALDTEDANGNGFLDYDPTRGETEDRGYKFTPPGYSSSGPYSTVIGSGPGLSSSTRGDGMLNTEDLNGNGILDTTENIIKLNGSIIKGTPTASISIAAGSTSWQKVRLYIDRSATSPFSSYLSLLKQIRSIRLSITGVSGSGRIYIDSLRFVSSRWRNIKINDASNEDPSKFSVTFVDSINDSEYRSNSFLLSKKDIYQSLHGEKTDRELEIEQETALEIYYNSLSGRGSVSRKFGKEMDLRFYKTFSIWLNYRTVLPSTIGVRIGSSENDYYSYEFTPDYPDTWREVKLNLRDGSGGINKIGSTGHPDLKRITYMEVIVYSTGSGKIWVNDIYAGDAETLVDSAYWYEGEIRGKRPLFVTASGVPVLSDLNIRVIEKGHGAQFSTVGKTQSDVMERYREIFSSVKILPAWSARIDLISEESSTDSMNTSVTRDKRGKSGKTSFLVESEYAPTGTAVPSVKLIYKNDLYRNTRSDFLEVATVSHEFREEREEQVQNPVIVVRENLEQFLGGRLTASIQVDTTFKEESVVRNSTTLSKSSLNSQVPASEREKRQKGSAEFSADYQGPHLYVQPTLTLFSQEIVNIQGRAGYADTGVGGDMEGGFHAPFIYTGDYRFVERNKRGGLTVGFRNLGPVSPSWKAEMVYYENSFRDYDDGERLLSGSFSRDKDARSFVSNTYSVPFDFSSWKSLEFISSMTFSYTRSLQLQEQGIPYEGEAISSFDERYGINRTWGGLYGEGFNLAKYPPWHYLTGRGNYANGRDFAYARFNRPLTFTGGTVAPDYDNSLSLIDTFSFNTTLNFQRWTVSLGSGLNQVCERRSVEGVPQQVITLNANADFTFDLMRFFSFSFFRPNAPDFPYHSASLNLGYVFSRNMLITANTVEDVHSPGMGIVFKRDRASLGLKAGIDLRNRHREEYIDQNGGNDSRDDVYLENMQKNPYFREIDRGYRFSALYETDVRWIHEFFSSFYILTAFPIFSLEYALLLNRYDYTRTVSPEPYDQHLVTGKLTLDLHRNVQGGLVGRWALERFRNRETGNVYREIMSYEVGMNFSLVF